MTTIQTEMARHLRDPLKLGRLLWPEVSFYDKQREVIYSVRDNDETFVPAGNMLGKDFVGGFIAVTFFLLPVIYMRSQGKPTEVRVVTTSVKDDHLRVLWGEVGRFLKTARKDTPFGPLLKEDGGQLIVNHRDIRKIVDGKVCDISYLRGMVSERGEGMAGHHAAHTLLIIDEASGVDDLVYTQGDTWAKKKLIIGNCNPCAPTHFFHRGVKQGDLVGKEHSEV